MQVSSWGISGVLHSVISLGWVVVGFIYLHRATVTLFSFLQKPIATDGRGNQTVVVWFIQQAAGAPAHQVFLIVVAAAATESPRNIPAEGINKKGLFDNRQYFTHTK